MTDGKGNDMKEFFKRYSYDSVKMLVDQFAISVFGFSLALAAVKFKSDTLLLITSLGAILFYLFLLYGVAWNVGYRRYNTVKRGDEKPQWLTGLWISLLANSPNLILAMINAIDTKFGPDLGVGIARGIALFIQGMYQGLLSVVKLDERVFGAWGWTYFEQFGRAPLNAAWWSYFLIVIPALLICTFGYIFGVKGWHLTGMMMPQVPLSDRPTKQELKERKKDAKKAADPSDENPS